MSTKTTASDLVDIRADLESVFADGEGMLGHFTCTEIDYLARALARLGLQGLAEHVIRGHVYDLCDSEDDTHDHLITKDEDGRHFTMTDVQRALIKDHVIRLVAGIRQPGWYWGPDGEEGPLYG